MIRALLLHCDHRPWYLTVLTMLPLLRMTSLARNRRNLAKSEPESPENLRKTSFTAPLRFSVTNPATGLHICTLVRTPSLDKDAKMLTRPARRHHRRHIPPAVSMPPTPRTSSAQLSMRTPPSSPAYGRVPPPSNDQKSSHVSRAHWRSASRPWRSSRRYRQVVLYGRCALSSAVSPNGCES